MKIHWNILDEKQKSVLPLLKNFSEDGFYLAGGTGLALQIGHRDSDDFDFFKKGDFDTGVLKKKFESVFKGHKISTTQEEKNTLSCDIDNGIQLSFFGYDYDLLKPLIETEYFKIASMADIACMKLQSITGRAVEKDYVDLYFVLQNMSLSDLLDLCEKKHPTSNKYTILKSLSFFDDVYRGSISFKEGHKVSWEQIKKHLEKLMREFVRQKTLESTRKSNIQRDKGIER